MAGCLSYFAPAARLRGWLGTGVSALLLALAWSVNRFGFALCGIDMPGHGGAVADGYDP